MPTDPETRPIRWPPDLLRRPFAPRQTPRSAPSEGVFDPPYRCVLVNEAWISHVVGMVDVLTEEDSWAGEEPVRYTAIQQIEAFLRALAVGNCTMGITDIRVNECKLEVEFNDSGEWVEVGDLTACVVPGPPGEPGLDGASAELRYIDKGGGNWWVQWRQSDDDPTWTDLFAVPPGGVPGPPGLDGASAELRLYEGWVQWRQSDDDPTWTNLFELPQDGTPGEEGASAELRLESGWVQWRQSDDDPTWTNLFELPQDGTPGEDGQPGASVVMRSLYEDDQKEPHYGQTWLQWRREDEYVWYDLFRVDDLCPAPCSEPDIEVERPDPDARWCRVAGYITNALQSVWSDLIGNAEQGAVALAVIESLLIVAGTLVSPAFAPLFISLKGGIAGMELLVILGWLAVSNEENTAMWDLVKCAVYKSRYADAPLVPNDALLNVMKTFIQVELVNANYTFNAVFMAQVLDTITAKGYQLLALSALDDDPDYTCAELCEEPPGLPADFNFFRFGQELGEEGSGLWQVINEDFPAYPYYDIWVSRPEGKGWRISEAYVVQGEADMYFRGREIVSQDWYDIGEIISNNWCVDRIDARMTWTDYPIAMSFAIRFQVTQACEE